jgi:MoaA/NifB/PqqE/SkfB family radical SAM enzyme
MDEGQQLQTQDAATPRILDVIYCALPHGATVKGPSALQWREGGLAYRWFCGSEALVTFSLPSRVPSVLRVCFENVFEGQDIRLTANGMVLAEHKAVPLGRIILETIKFEAEKENTISVQFSLTSKRIGAYPEDARDLAIVCREFSVWPAEPVEPGALEWLKRLPETLSGLCGGGAKPIVGPLHLQRLPADRFRLDSIAHLGDPEANAKLSRQEYESGAVVLRSLPSVVTLALTTFCNNRIPCVICDRNTRSACCDSEIDADLLEKATPLLKTARYVLLHCGGESMFSRHFDEAIARIEPPTRVSFATNAMLMTNKRADRMLEKDIMAGFVVSMDAATRETYEIMRPGSKFDTVVSNVAYYIAQTKRLGRTESNITLNMTLCEANIHEAPKLVDLAASIGAWGVDFNHLNAGLTHVARTSAGWDWDYVAQSQFKDKEFHDRMLLEAYYKAKEKDINLALVGQPFLGPNAEKYQEIVCDMTCQVAFQEGAKGDHWQSPHHKKVAQNIPSCFKPWQETVIQPDGSVRVCYFHEIGTWSIGHLKTSDFMSIWNSDQMVMTRQQFYANAFARSCAESQPCMHRGRQ